MQSTCWHCVIMIDLRAQVATSQLLKRVFATVLATGNALNAGTAYGDADGFRLETLQKLGGVKVGSCAPLCKRSDGAGGDLLGKPNANTGPRH